jgi:hypothetical protein
MVSVVLSWRGFRFNGLMKHRKFIVFSSCHFLSVLRLHFEHKILINWLAWRRFFILHGLWCMTLTTNIYTKLYRLGMFNCYRCICRVKYFISYIFILLLWTYYKYIIIVKGCTSTQLLWTIIMVLDAGLLCAELTVCRNGRLYVVMDTCCRKGSVIC